MKEEQVFENGKMWLAADGSLWCSCLADAPVWSYVNSGGQRHRLVVLHFHAVHCVYWHALHAGHIFSLSAVDLRYEIMNPGNVVDPWKN